MKYVFWEFLDCIVASLPSWERGLKCLCIFLQDVIRAVAPFVGAWIEIRRCIKRRLALLVAPFVGAWIEIGNTGTNLKYKLSLPSWERGLKFHVIDTGILTGKVAPFVGAWIEIARSGRLYPLSVVAPFVGAWIEIAFQLSHVCFGIVAPFVGAWIEIKRNLRMRVKA